MRLRVTLLCLLHLLVSVVAAAEPAVSSNARIFKQLDAQFRGSPDRTGFVLFDLNTDADLFSYRARELFMPASILKLLTSYTALIDLGPDYRFSTDILRTGSRNDTHLFIRAGADPNLRTEDLEIIARQIRMAGVARVASLVADTSLVSSTRPRTGQRAYEAGSAALVLNFNSLAFEVCPNAPGQEARVVTSPYEYSVDLQGSIRTVAGRGGGYGIDQISDGRYRLTGSIASSQGCVRQYRSLENSTEYFLRVLRERLQAMGIAVENTKIGSTPATAALLYRHSSKALSQILEDLNHFSTNVTAEQILTAIGRTSERQMSHRAGVGRLLEVARRFGGADTVLHDGAGLNRLNMMSPQVLRQVLAAAHQNVKINVEFEKSLSVLGRNGTLKNRPGMQQGMVVRGKTGSLNGVSSIAGYMYPAGGREFGFVMIQNGVGDRQSKHRREHLVLKLLNRLQ